jgi:hypothetical protein
MRVSERWLGVSAMVATMGWAGAAQAHIQLLSPASWTVESSLGDPQKNAPCGGEGGSPTGAVTQYKPGQKIIVKWQETIYHPGHFRIAFASDRSQLHDPDVIFDSAQDSVSASIEDPPVAPVLLDNLYPRTPINGSAGTVFQQEVTLPNITCARCTLQVLQFMAGHGPPNYIYHHCADIQLTPDAVTPPGSGDDGGAGGGGGGNSGGTGATAQGGSGCSLGGGDGAAGGLALVLGATALWLLRRRSRRSR